MPLRDNYLCAPEMAATRAKNLNRPSFPGLGCIAKKGGGPVLTAQQHFVRNFYDRVASTRVALVPDAPPISAI